MRYGRAWHARGEMSSFCRPAVDDEPGVFFCTHRRCCHDAGHRSDFIYEPLEQYRHYTHLPEKANHAYPPDSSLTARPLRLPHPGAESVFGSASCHADGHASRLWVHQPTARPDLRSGFEERQHHTCASSHMVVLIQRHLEHSTPRLPLHHCNSA